ncbi:hypothetical protein AWM75_03140 [Aerococcus urinaehominis]|uniref:Uncharacterized protein n=1 Tax=Aerococcus urinaehominis TaxID=128944 RepID=A0A109RHM5_9LACT|nr:PTS transporter subunit EIIC [Aerococcus urinaehominis]AMB99056.1 hypothetical protein AWM75_03140 [Aerococcus urinaehominis]SDM59234.1 PTS system, beta-glucosides-specific IIC component [Aerococcus urinaehominis]
MNQTQTGSKSVINRILDALKEIFAPNLVALSAAGILQGITIILHSLGIIQEGRAEYIILNTISSAVFYFLPILLAFSAARVFNTSQVLAACVAMFLLHPDIVANLQQYGGTADFFGVPLPPGHYPSSVIPIIVIVWAQQYIERFWHKIIPDLVEGVFAPMLTLATMAILALTILGPIGELGAGALLWVINFFSTKAAWLVPTLLGGFGIFVVMTGAHYSLFPVVMQSLAAGQPDTFFIPGMMASNIALAAAVLAVVIKTNSGSYRQYTLSATITAALGVSQPGLYGVAIPMRNVMVAAISGGLAGGLYAGIAKVYAYAFVNPGLAALPAFISPDGSIANMVNVLIEMAIAGGIAFAIVMLTPYHELADHDIAEITRTK